MAASITAGDIGNAYAAHPHAASIPSTQILGKGSPLFSFCGSIWSRGSRGNKAAGDVVGFYVDRANVQHGFKEQSVAIFSALDAQASMNNGALPAGSLTAGLVTDMMTNVRHGYLASKDVFVPFDFPFSTSTTVWDMSSARGIVGVYTDSAKRAHGYLLKLDDLVLTFGVNPQFGVNGSFSFSSIDFPGAAQTRAFGISAQGSVVGSYGDATGKTHGYLLTQPQDSDD
jgi:hypothetical protein